MLLYKQKRLDREMDKRRCLDKTVLIRPARHMVCLFASCGQCADMHAAFEFLFAPPNWSDFDNWISIQILFSTRHAKYSLMLLYKLRRGWKENERYQICHVRCVLWFLRIYFVFFRGSFHDGRMSFEYMPGWILFKASLEGGSKTSISCCRTSRRGWRGRWTKEDA